MQWRNGLVVLPLHTQFTFEVFFKQVQWGFELLEVVRMGQNNLLMHLLKRKKVYKSRSQLLYL
jgi:hypothetical protein